MTQTRDLIKKMADFFTGEEFYEKGEDARLELSPDDVRCMNEIIKACGNAISRQAVIDIIHRFFTEEVDKIPTKKTEDGEVLVIHKCQPLFAMNKAICKRIKALQAVNPQEPKWIPVSERLPNIHNRSENYLVTLKRGGVHIALFTECDGKHWWTYDDVIAWMPLPEPYKAESEG